jgi:TonB family protein
MVKKILFLTGLVLISVLGFSQDQVYKVVEEMPRFPGCEGEEVPAEQKYDCAQRNLLSFVYDQIVYPQEAIEKELSGNVVVSFVVTDEGLVKDPKVVKDIGGGCGEEALRVVKLMNETGLKWRPGYKDGQPVNVEFNLPIRFKLEKPLDFQLVGRDSIFVKYDTAPTFIGGDEALEDYLASNIKMPEVKGDTCIFGYIDVTALIRANGEVLVSNIANYSNLPFEFVFESIYKIHKTYYMWKPAVYKGRKVPTLVDIRVNFLPENGPCVSKVAELKKAGEMVDDALQKFQTEEKDLAISQMNQAVDMFPENAEFKYLRGQMLIEQQKFAEACPDYRYVRKTLNIPEVDQLALIICNQP